MITRLVVEVGSTVLGISLTVVMAPRIVADAHPARTTASRGHVKVVGTSGLDLSTAIEVRTRGGWLLAHRNATLALCLPERTSSTGTGE